MAELIDPKGEEKKVAETKVQKPGMGYIPIRFCTKGKLSAPKVLHFRNYKMEEAVELSRIKDDLFEEYLIEILNKMVWEDFDCGQLHKEELVEVLLNIHVNFWKKTLDGFQYYKDVSLSVEERDKPENVLHGSIDISKLDSVDLPSEFKEPISITTKNGIVHRFKLLRMEDRVNIRKEIDEEFRDREREYEVVRLRVLENPSLTTSQIEPQLISKFIEYHDLMSEKEIRFRTYVEYAKLNSIDGKEFPSLKEKVKAAQDIDLSVWSSLTSALRNLNFGINEEVTFFSQELNENVTRRFRFRLMDFIPSLDMENSAGNTISFGV